jgi:hypothetical protein
MEKIEQCNKAHVIEQLFDILDLFVTAYPTLDSFDGIIALWSKLTC